MSTTISGTTGVSQVQDGIITPVKTQVGALPSMVRVMGANGLSAFIRLFTTLITSQGSDITYAAGAGTFTINTNGVYAITCNENVSAGAWAAITLNTTQTGTDPTALTNPSEILSLNVSPSANYTIVNCWTGYLPSGSILRSHTGGGAAGANQLRGTSFTIVRIA